jgi:hypothetical protein
MSSRRKLVAYAAIGVVVGGHLFDLAADREHWPFSTYPMYSYPMNDQLRVYRLMGVVDDETGADADMNGDAEFPLVSGRYLRPLNALGLASGLGYLNRKPDRERLLDEAMGDVLARYERRRAAGGHDGPRLRAIRLYRLHWTMNPSASNRDRPDRRELIYEAPAREHASR